VCAIHQKNRKQIVHQEVAEVVRCHLESAEGGVAWNKTKFVFLMAYMTKLYSGMGT
jgi:hypothetical protein